MVEGNVDALYVLGDNDKGDDGAVGAPALYVIDGRGIEFMSSCDCVGACDIRKPICTVADEAIEESLRCLPLPNTGGGGGKPLIS